MAEDLTEIIIIRATEIIILTEIINFNFHSNFNFYFNREIVFNWSPYLCHAPKYNNDLDQNLIISSAKICSHGKIQVIFCKSLNSKLKPFPNNFWLTCPYLIKLASKIEADGGVHDLQKYLTGNNKSHDWNKFNYLHQVIRINLIDLNTRRFLRKYRPKIFNSLRLNGIGGINYKSKSGINIKCLHLQTASYLALNFHPGSEWLNSKNLNLNAECNCPEKFI